MEKLRDEALRGHPSLWIRWYGRLGARIPAGVARLHLPGQATRPPTMYSLPPVSPTTAITLGETVSAEARVDALHRDQERIAEEGRVAALPRQPGPTRCDW